MKLSMKEQDILEVQIQMCNSMELFFYRYGEEPLFYQFSGKTRIYRTSLDRLVRSGHVKQTYVNGQGRGRSSTYKMTARGRKWLVKAKTLSTTIRKHHEARERATQGMWEDR